MSKKFNLLLALTMLLLPLVVVTAQNLQNNPDYRESLRYKQLSEQALEEGEYEKALEYAEKSKEFSQKSEEYVQYMLAKYRANSALWKARNRMGQVKRAGGQTSNPSKFQTAQELVERASTLFDDEVFDESRRAAVEAVDILNSIEIKRAESTLPAAYVVRDMPGREDCFWRIAGYEFVYDDPSGWWPIYQANREKLPQPDNPDLIYPGTVMVIPERSGETRRGVWVDGTIKAEAP